MNFAGKTRIALLFLLLATASVALAGTVVQFRTTLGDFDVELFDKDKPVTVGNFLRYVTNGIYTDMFMHRGATNFVIQGGGFQIAGRGTTNPMIASLPAYAPITNEFLSGKFCSNTYGTIAMAKTSDPNSATSQFFLNLGNNALALDNTNNSGGFTVFGRVISGTNILNRFNPGPTNILMKLVSLGPFAYGGVFQELPVLSTATNTLTDLDLLYVNTVVVIPNGFTFPVQLTASGNQRNISWTSVNSVTNYVDYTTSANGVWQTLVATNGNSARYTVTDTVPAGSGSRFYRVRIGYAY